MTSTDPVQESHNIYHSLMIQGNIDDVYKAITQPNHLTQWWPNKCTGSPSMNTEYSFQFGPKFHWRGRVVEAVAPHGFAVKMTLSDDDWLPTTFSFHLSENKNKVLVDFSHTDWPKLNHHFKKSSFSWAILLNGLKNYIEKGEVIPFESRA